MISYQRLKERLNYNQDTGVFTWLVAPTRSRSAGCVAGGVSGPGYIYIMLDAKLYLAHRLAWLYMTGEWPPGQIDHRDRVKANNRWSNLRIATQSQNEANTPPRRNNTSGFKGVSWHKQYGAWEACIKRSGKTDHLGYFDVKEDAATAYERAAREMHGEFAYSPNPIIGRSLTCQ